MVPSQFRRVFERPFPLVCIGAGVAVFTASCLPGIDVGQQAEGDGKSTAFKRTITLITYIRPGTFIYLVGSVVLVAVGIAALVRGSSAWLAAVACAVVAVGLFHSLESTRHVWNNWDEHSVKACNDGGLRDCAGGFLYPAIRDLNAQIERQGLEPLDPNAYRARTLAGWDLLVIALTALAPFAMFTLLRAALRRWVAALATAALMVLGLVLWVMSNLSGLD